MIFWISKNLKEIKLNSVNAMAQCLRYFSYSKCSYIIKSFAFCSILIKMYKSATQQKQNSSNTALAHTNTQLKKQYSFNLYPL